MKFRPALFSLVLVLIAGCSGPKPAGVQDLSGSEDLSFFKLATIGGTRDGDQLPVKALFTDSSSMLNLDLRFRIGTPTALENGTWRWSRSGRLQQGTVTARSVTFLGGQNGPPSIGGTFELLESGVPRYKVVIPTTVLADSRATR